MKASEFMAEVDRLTQMSLDNSPVKPCCSKGCSHCCSEPLYSSEEEVDYMLGGLTETQRIRVETRTRAWIQKAEEFFAVSKLRPDGLHNAFEYRDANIECPFLENKLCMVYERRPMGCRTFFAMGNPDHCAMPYRRKQLVGEFDFENDQWFSLFDEWTKTDNINRRLDNDHMGIILHNKLFNDNKHTSARQNYGR
jgi:Fe-S-cluster containining protein